ncbi:MAG: pantothenate metabolism flavoprotein [Candidatus Saccharibacteria bacterium]|nr:pantothenate metabolism flavoprotein [Rhodoferax sp.]
MASITVRNLDDSVKNSLRVRAARHGWSMAQEIRQILQQTVAPEQAQQISFAERVNQRFASLKIVNLPIPARPTLGKSPGKPPQLIK